MWKRRSVARPCAGFYKFGDIGSYCFAFTLEFCSVSSQRNLLLRFVPYLRLGSFASVEDLYIRCLGVSHFLVALPRRRV